MCDSIATTCTVTFTKSAILRHPLGTPGVIKPGRVREAAGAERGFLPALPRACAHAVELQLHSTRLAGVAAADCVGAGRDRGHPSLRPTRLVRTGCVRNIHRCGLFRRHLFTLAANTLPQYSLRMVPSYSLLHYSLSGLCATLW